MRLYAGDCSIGCDAFIDLSTKDMALHMHFKVSRAMKLCRTLTVTGIEYATRPACL